MIQRITVSQNLTPWKQRQKRRKIADDLFARTVKAISLGQIPHHLPGLVCGAKTSNATACIRVCRAGEIRCYLHGGRSAGAKTAEGKAASALGRKIALDKKKEAKRYADE